MTITLEQEVLDGRRAFAKAQELLAGAVAARLPNLTAVGWHDTEVHPETGSFAVVAAGSRLAGMVGQILRVTTGGRSIYVYVLGARGVPTDLSLTRRSFLALGLLTHESLNCVLEVVGS